jgi:hypothetical protein
MVIGASPRLALTCVSGRLTPAAVDHRQLDWAVVCPFASIGKPTAQDEQPSVLTLCKREWRAYARASAKSIRLIMVAGAGPIQRAHGAGRGLLLA